MRRIDAKESVRRKRNFKWANFSASGFHYFITFVPLLILAIVFQDRLIRGRASFSSLVDIGAGVLDVTTATLSVFRLSGTLLVVPFITGTAHLLVAAVKPIRKYIERTAFGDDNEAAGYNFFRWGEYAISASFVTYNVAQVSGLTDVRDAISLAALNIMMQGCGAAHEWVNRGWTHKSKKSVNWWFFVAGFVPFVATWINIWWGFIRAATSSSDAVPGFVYAVVIGIFLQYSAFVVPILLRYNRWWTINNFWYEVAYIVLSFASKSYQDYVIFGGALSRLM